MLRFHYGNGDEQRMQLMDRSWLLFQSIMVIQNLRVLKFIKLELSMEQSNEEKLNINSFTLHHHFCRRDFRLNILDPKTESIITNPIKWLSMTNIDTV